MVKRHIVEQGECLLSIAKHHGFSEWRSIYDHPDNSELRRKRPDPNLLFPKDRIAIPNKGEQRIESGQTESRHIFRLTTPRAILRLVIKFDNDEPFVDEPYVLTVEDQEFEGVTDRSGLIEQLVLADAMDGHLQLPERQLTWRLRLGHLDPPDELAGVQGRLNNLGFLCGEVDGVMGPLTAMALRTYQRMRKHEVSGELDEATRVNLVKEHDGV